VTDEVAAHAGAWALSLRDRFRWLPLAIAALLLVGGCGDDDTLAPPEARPYSLATVAGQAITHDQFLAEIRRRGGQDPALLADAAGKRALLATMIEDRVLVERARAAGFDQDPEAVAAFERVMVGRFREQTLNPRLAEVEVSSDEIESAYRDRIADYTRPAMSRVAVIRLALPADARADIRLVTAARAAEILDKTGSISPDERGFGALAARYSDHQASRYRGGDIGWIVDGSPADRWPAELVDAVQDLASPGDTAPLVEAADGYYLVRLIERRPQQVEPLAAVAERLRADIRQQKQREIEAEWLAGLRAATPIEIDDVALRALDVSGSVPLESKRPDPKREPAPPGLPSG
jgi:parvulin-like peptidyl-prolyl isomerase